MALPTRSDLLTLDIAYMGQPFVKTASKPDIILNNLDISYMGQPFWGCALPYSLYIQDSSQNHSSEKTTLILRYILDILNSVHLQNCDSSTVSKHMSLLIHNAEHSQEAEHLIFAAITLLFLRKNYTIAMRKNYTIARKYFNPVRHYTSFKIK